MSVFAHIIPNGTITEERQDELALVAHISFKVSGHDVLAHVFLPDTAPDWAFPICGQLFLNDRKLWSFKDEDFTGRVHLLTAEETPVLTFVGRESGKLEKVASVPLLVKGESLGLKAGVSLKTAAADVLNISAEFSATERKILASEQEEARLRRVQEQEKRQAQKQAEAEARRQKHQQQIAELKARPQYALQSSTGKNLLGITVEGDEWMVLPDGTWCVSVEGYDSQTGRCITLLEHFVVSRKKGANARKDAVTADLSFRENRRIEPPKPLRNVLLEYNGDIHELPVYDKQGVKLLIQLKVPTVFAGTQDGNWIAARIAVSPEGIVTLQKVADAQPFEMAG